MAVVELSILGYLLASQIFVHFHTIINSSCFPGSSCMLDTSVEGNPTQDSPQQRKRQLPL